VVTEKRGLPVSRTKEAVWTASYSSVRLLTLLFCLEEALKACGTVDGQRLHVQHSTLCVRDTPTATGERGRQLCTTYHHHHDDDESRFVELKRSVTYNQ